jgi:hypothetical protein
MSELNWLPKHVAGLYLEHNTHKGLYQSTEDYCADKDEDWVSEYERLKAIQTDSVWTIQWYPNTPIGFIKMNASTLEALRDWVLADKPL